MRRSTFLHIAREGWPATLLATLLAALCHFYVHPVLAMLVLVVALLLALFFYEPTRSVPSEPLAVVTPVDGVVTVCEPVQDPWLDREALHIRLRLSPLGAYMIRSPVEGTVLEIPADKCKANTGIASWIRTDEQDDVIVAVSRGSLLGASPLTVRYGERVGQGRRNGVRRLALEMDLYLPSNTRPEVELSDRVQAGRNVLATLVHKQNGQNGHNSENAHSDDGDAGNSATQTA